MKVKVLGIIVIVVALSLTACGNSEGFPIMGVWENTNAGVSTQVLFGISEGSFFEFIKEEGACCVTEYSGSYLISEGGITLTYEEKFNKDPVTYSFNDSQLTEGNLIIDGKVFTKGSLSNLGK
ncbi:MAG: hypothetical protein JXR63_13590 [Spirochaetales bacterium]|nr:hypothetical protein [Spirochaetales bacterium]